MRLAGCECLDNVQAVETGQEVSSVQCVRKRHQARLRLPGGPLTHAEDSLENPKSPADDVDYRKEDTLVGIGSMLLGMERRKRVTKGRKDWG